MSIQLSTLILFIVAANAHLASAQEPRAAEPASFYEWCVDQTASDDTRHTTMKILQSLDMPYDVDQPETSCRHADKVAKMRTGLFLVNVEIRDIRPIASLVQLESLHLSFNQIVDIGPLAALRNLRVLDLERNQVVDVSALKNLPTLGSLNISDNPLADLEQITELSQVKIVEMRNVTERTSAVANTSPSPKKSTRSATETYRSPRIEVPIYYGYYGYCGYYVGWYQCPYWSPYYGAHHVAGAIITGAVVYSTLNWLFP